MIDILKAEMEAGQRVLLVGKPGCGKTCRVQAAAKACGKRLVSIRLSMAERVDIGGCLVPDSKAGVTRALPLEVMKDLRTTTVPTVLFYDDCGQAPLDVQASVMQTFDDGYLSPYVDVWGATNSPWDKAGVVGLVEPLRSRFNAAYTIPWPGAETPSDGSVMLHSWDDELDGWLNWAGNAGADPTIRAFHKWTKGKFLYDWKPTSNPAVRMPDYRTWGTMIKRLRAGLSSHAQIAACIGPAAAAQFTAYQRLGVKCPNAEEVWLHPDTAPIPDETSAQWLVAVILADSVKPTVVPAFMRYVQRMDRVLMCFACQEMYRRLGGAVMQCKEWIEWWKANKTIFQR